MSISAFLQTRVTENEDRSDLLSLGDHVGLRRDFDADRAAIDRHHDRTMVVTSRSGAETVTRCGFCPKEATRPCRALKVLALPYADHVDYDPSWHIELPVAPARVAVITLANDAAALLVAAMVDAAADATALETTRAAAAVADAVSATAAEVAQTVSGVEAELDAEVAATARALEGMVALTAGRVAAETTARASDAAITASQAATAVVSVRQRDRAR